eukprot:SAG11_NODE_6346_length_1331_cov_3.189935_1_plen_72_part_00
MVVGGQRGVVRVGWLGWSGEGGVVHTFVPVLVRKKTGKFCTCRIVDAQNRYLTIGTGLGTVPVHQASDRTF